MLTCGHKHTADAIIYADFDFLLLADLVANECHEAKFVVDVATFLQAENIFPALSCVPFARVNSIALQGQFGEQAIAEAKIPSARGGQQLAIGKGMLHVSPMRATQIAAFAHMNILHTEPMRPIRIAIWRLCRRDLQRITPPKGRKSADFLQNCLLYDEAFMSGREINPAAVYAPKKNFSPLDAQAVRPVLRQAQR